jgi:hypothetical protein
MVINGICSQERCHPDSGCILGETVASNCSHWKATSDVPITHATTSTRGSFPWTGSAFGLDDISLISGHTRPRLIALVGPHNAGKTTYLAALHLLCIRKQIVPNLCFCGSMTFGGWERIADFMRYPKESDPSYPPHTPISTDRTPGMLHYAFRDSEEQVRNLLFTDAPGEWFTNWATDPNPYQFPGATWTIAHADAFLFFIDRESLSGTKRGLSRLMIKTLSGRLAEHLHGRPLGIVWSKSDVEIEPGIKSAIKEIIDRNFPTATHFHTSFKPGGDDTVDVIAPLTASFVFASEKTQITNHMDVYLKPQIATDAFLSYRGFRHAK